MHVLRVLVYSIPGLNHQTVVHIMARHLTQDRAQQREMRIKRSTRLWGVAAHPPPGADFSSGQAPPLVHV